MEKKKANLTGIRSTFSETSFTPVTIERKTKKTDLLQGGRFISEKMDVKLTRQEVATKKMHAVTDGSTVLAHFNRLLKKKPGGKAQ